MIKIQEMENLLHRLLGGDNAKREAAERVVNELEKQPEEYMISLISVLRTSTLSSVRNLACILIRQKLNVSEEGLWLKLDPNFQCSFRNELLQLLETEKELNIREKICQCIGELGLNLLENNQWPELLPILLSLSQSLDPATQLSGLTILHYIVPYFASMDRDDIPSLIALFHQTLQQHEQPLIQVETCRAVCSLLSKLDTNDTIQFVTLIPLILRALSDMLNREHTEFACEIIRAMSDLVEVHATFFKQNLESLIQAMVSIARSKALDDDTRQASLEFLTLLIENSPNMIRSLPTSVLLTPLLQILFSILVDIDPDPAHTWEQDETEPDEAEPSMFNYTLGVLARVSQAIRGRVLLPPLYALIDQSMHNADWRHRHAVMYTLCQVGEIVTDDTQRRQIAQYVITSFQDAHPRVRYASVRCLGQLATDFQPFLQHELSVSALTAIFSLLHADQPVRVRFITAAALINFVDGAEPAILQPVLGDMLHALLGALPASPILVQKQILAAIAAIADCVGPALAPFYSAVMPVIKPLYTEPSEALKALEAAERRGDSTERSSYRSTALECITCVGAAAEVPQYRQDARDVLEVMYREGMGEVEESSEMKNAMMSAWGRMCSALKEDFLPYVDMIVPILLKTAKQDVETPEELDDFLDDFDEDTDNIRTNAMEEKAIACRTLALLLNTLHSGLASYLPAITQTLPPLLNSTFDDIKMAALASIPDLLTAISETVQDPASIEAYRQTFLSLIDLLLSFIADEPELDMLLPALQTLFYCMPSAVLQRNGPIPIMQGAEVARIIEVLHAALKASFERRAILSADVEHADWDEEEVEEFQEIEEGENQSHYWIASILGELLNGHADFALPLLHEILLPELLDACDPSRTAGDRIVSLMVMEKIVEYCGKDALSYYPQFLPIFRRELRVPDASIREVAAQALRWAAEFGGDLLWDAAEPCVRELQSALEDPVSAEACYAEANQWGIVAMGKLGFHCGPAIAALPAVYRFWLDRLPIEDAELLEICMSVMCALLEKGDAAFLGEAQQNVPRILQVLCESLGRLGSAAAVQQVLRMIKTIEMQASPELMNALWNVLGSKAETVRQKLQSV